MNLFKRSRSRSPSMRSTPSFEIPKLCFSRQKRAISIDTTNSTVDTLDVPTTPRGRSSSYDGSFEHAQSTLEVPKTGRRSKSFDAACPYSGSSDENISDQEKNYRLPRYQRTRGSLDIPKLCIHCVHIEALEAAVRANNRRLSLAAGDTENQTDSNNLRNRKSYDFSSDSSSDEWDSDSVSSDNNSHNSDQDVEPQKILDPSVVVSLEVPVIIKEHRSSSVDSGLLQQPEPDSRRSSLDPSEEEDGEDKELLKAPRQNRSSSVDVSLPTDDNAYCYEAIACVPKPK